MPRCDGCPCEGLPHECPAIARPAPGLCEPGRRERYAAVLIGACLAEQHPLGTDRTNGRRWDDGPAPQLSTVDSEEVTAWPAVPRDGRVRVGLALPMVYLGGMEAWGAMLARSLDPARLVWAGTAADDDGWRSEQAVGWLERSGPVRIGSGQVAALMRACDVLIVSGADVPPKPRPCKVVLLAHGEAEWSRQRVARAAECEALGAVSEAARATFPEAERGRVRVIPNCFDPERIEPKASRPETRARWGVEAGRRVALYLGRLSHEKRPLAFLDMLRALPPEWVGVLHGIGADEAAVRAAAESLGDRVRIPGPTDDVGGAIAAADVGVIPSEQEGCCLAMLEMMAGGLPVVATPAGHARELEDLITLVRPMAEGPELAAAVLATMGNPWRVTRRGHAMRYTASVHGPEAFGRAWSDLIWGMVDHAARDRMRRLAKARTCPDRGDPLG